MQATARSSLRSLVRSGLSGTYIAETSVHRHSTSCILQSRAKSWITYIWTRLTWTRRYGDVIDNRLFRPAKRCVGSIASLLNLRSLGHVPNWQGGSSMESLSVTMRAQAKRTRLGQWTRGSPLRIDPMIRKLSSRDEFLSLSGEYLFAFLWN